MNNTFGNIYRLTTFGESHGRAIGGVIDGMPAGLKFDFDRLRHAISRRRPGQSAIVTARNEPDEVEILSGLFDGVTTGAPIGFTIANVNQHSADYDELRHKFRPSHADYTYAAKYGIRDHRGGGRSSARETAARIVGGEFARQALEGFGISIYAYTSQVGDISLPGDYRCYGLAAIDMNPVRCPDEAVAEKMISLIGKVKGDGDTVGGVVTCVIKGCPAGLGDPVFGKLQARLAAAMMSINAAKGFDYGMGFDGVGSRGSDVVDEFICDEDGGIHTSTNYSGGIQGGISNGEDIYFRVAFKPVATLLRELTTVDDTGAATSIHARGRHDPCVLPRAVPVVEAMAAMVVFDSVLLNRVSRL